jgi:hypothetical protein
MADAYVPAENVPAGGKDRSDAFGPTVVGVDGIEVPRAVMHGSGGYQTHASMTGDTTVAPALRDTDGDDGLPDLPRYEGPSVSDQPALLNPSAGTQGPAGGGVNPMGESPVPGTQGPPFAGRQVAE